MICLLSGELHKKNSELHKKNKLPTNLYIYHTFILQALLFLKMRAYLRQATIENLMSPIVF